MRFRASEMPRVVKCNGSKKLQELYPKRPSDDSLEGDVAHKIAAAVLRDGKTLDSFLNQSIDNVLVDQEFLNYVEIYTQAMDNPGSIEVNAVLELDDGNVLSGTPDYWNYNFNTHLLTIKDLKFGHGWVEVYENWQLLSYMLIIMSTYPEILSDCKGVRLAIIQPRGTHPDGPVREWAFEVELYRNYRNIIIGSMQSAALDTARCITGPHCRYCSALLKCHSARAAVGYALDYSNQSAHSEITPEVLSLELELMDRAVTMLSQRKTALEEEAFALVKGGSVIPGWGVVPVASALKWTVDAVTIGDAMKVDLRAPVKPITPTQAISRKLLPKATVESLAAREAGGMKLKRVDNAKAKRILSNG